MEEWLFPCSGSGMLKLDFLGNGKDPVTVLCLGAHADDIEIGCGGTLLRFRKAFPRLRFHWVVFSAPGPRTQEARRSAELFTEGCDARIDVKDYPDGFLPYNGRKVKDCFEEIKDQVNPDLIFTHWSGDAHQDHRLVSELSWNTFRNHLVLEYEIPKYDGDMGRPNLFVPLEESFCRQKIDFLFQAFESQRCKSWFDRETFLALMRIRGMESNSRSGYAEAFYARKVVVGEAIEGGIKGG
jgi:LmbE family N-acetylglucosaminyl deacetylase